MIYRFDAAMLNMDAALVYSVLVEKSPLKRDFVQMGKTKRSLN